MRKISRKGTACALIAGICLLFLAGGCQGAGTSSASSDEYEGLVYSVPPALDVQIASLLTAEQVSQTIGVTVGEPALYEDGTWAQYTTDDRLTSVDVHMSKVSREVYDMQTAEIKETYPGRCVDAPNLGETAFFNTETQELLTYGKGYMIGVVVSLDKAGTDNAQLLAARSLAALLLEKL